MTEPTYTLKEIIELQFTSLRKDLQDIKVTLDKQNLESERRFTKIEKEIDDLRLDNARYKTIWGIGATLGATIFAFTLNKLF